MPQTSHYLIIFRSLCEIPQDVLSSGNRLPSVPSILQRPLPVSGGLHLWSPTPAVPACVQRVGDTSSSPRLRVPQSAASEICRAPWEGMPSPTQPGFLRRNSDTEFSRTSSDK